MEEEGPVTDIIRVALVNHAGLDDEDVEAGAAALGKQIREDFGPVWHVEATIQPVRGERGKRGTYERLNGYWVLVLLDETRECDEVEDPVLGYHDLTREGLPLGKVFVNRLEPGQDWTHPASHELLEMLADPDLSATVYQHPDALTVLLYAMEVCDPCAAYTDGYERGGRWVSDFAFPEWFQARALQRRRGGCRFDERRKIRHPFQVLPGGYIGVFDPSISAWRIQGSDGEQDEPRQVGSRLEKRSTPQNRLRGTDMIWCC
jgi:hypothetical protein